MIDLGSVLDELRVLLESMCRKESIELEWAVPDVTRSVWADQYGLIQVFLNLAKNSRRALENALVKRIRITTVQGDHSLVVRFEDTGPGISNPETLFRAFQRDAKATGLGLYVSRALMKSFGGDLTFEARDRGCCFAVTLQTPDRETRAGMKTTPRSSCLEAASIGKQVAVCCRLALVCSGCCRRTL